MVEQGAEVAKESRRLLVIKDDRVLAEIPALKVDQVIISGNVQVTTPALRLCMRQEIPVFFLSRGGRLYGAVDPMAPNRAALHRQQFRCADDSAFCLGVSQQIVRGKLTNCRTLIMRMHRREQSEGLAKCAASLSASLDSVENASTLDALRGIEGSAAAAYFKAWRGVLDDAWGFQGRQRRPPPDPVNCLLSYGYTLLFSNIFSLVRAQGLLPHIGFYHGLRRGHPALVSDLMEEFRAPVVDSTVLTLLRQRRVRPEDFEHSQHQGRPVSITPPARKRLIQGLETTFNRSIQHPDAAGACDYRRVISLQVRRLKDCVQSGEPEYGAFVTR